MPWHHGDYPPSYKNLPADIRAKAVEIANALLEKNMPEGEAIAIGVKNAREWALHHRTTLRKNDPEQRTRLKIPK